MYRRGCNVNSCTPSVCRHCGVFPRHIPLWITHAPDGASVVLWVIRCDEDTFMDVFDLDARCDTIAFILGLCTMTSLYYIHSFAVSLTSDISDI